VNRKKTSQSFASIIAVRLGRAWNGRRWVNRKTSQSFGYIIPGIAVGFSRERDGSKGEIVYPDVYEFIDGWLTLMSQLMDTRPDSWRDCISCLLIPYRAAEVVHQYD